MIEELRKIAEEMQRSARWDGGRIVDVYGNKVEDMAGDLTAWVEKYGPFVEAAGCIGARRQRKFLGGPTTYLDWEHRNFDLAYRKAMDRK